MKDELRELEKAARRLEPGAAQRERLLQEVICYSHRFLEAVATAPANTVRADLGIGLDDSPIAEEGMEISQVLELLAEHVDSVGINPTSGRFLGYIPGGGLFPSALGDFLAAITNRYAGLFFASPGAVRIENLLLRWMAGLVGYPDTAAGNLTSGGSLANLTAIVTARDDRGIVGGAIPRSVIYVTEHIHHCIDKALHVAGLDSCVKRKVPMDAGYRMQPAALVDALRADKANGLNPWMVIATAGTTNTGAVDPLREIGGVARDHGLWFHVDGAYGALFILCPEGREILHGIEQSDSVIMDPHKTLFLPYGTGAVLVRDRRKLYASHTWKADYAQDIPAAIEELSPAELAPELTRHFRGLRLWLPLKLLGVGPFRAALSEKIRLARYFYEQLQRIDGFEVGPYPDLSIVTFRYVPARGDPDEFNHRLTQAVQQDGRVFVSSTRVDGKFVLRLAVLCFRTHLSDVDEALDVLRRTAQRLAAA